MSFWRLMVLSDAKRAHQIPTDYNISSSGQALTWIVGRMDSDSVTTHCSLKNYFSITCSVLAGLPVDLRAIGGDPVTTISSFFLCIMKNSPVAVRIPPTAIIIHFMAPTMLMTRNMSSILSTYSWWSSMFWNKIYSLVNRVGWRPNNQITNSLFYFCK